MGKSDKVSIHKIIDIRKLSLIEASILVHLYKEYPKRLSVKDMLEHESYRNTYRSACNSLLERGLIDKKNYKYGFVWE